MGILNIFYDEYARKNTEQSVSSHFGKSISKKISTSPFRPFLTYHLLEAW